MDGQKTYSSSEKRSLYACRNTFAFSIKSSSSPRLSSRKRLCVSVWPLMASSALRNAQLPAIVSRRAPSVLDSNRSLLKFVR